MSQNTSSPSPSFIPFQVHVVSSTQKSKSQDSPTSSILKTPTAIFVSTRSSSSKTRKLKFANGPVDLETSYRQRREGSQDSASSASSSVAGDIKQNNGGIDSEGNYVEVAISPVKRMKVSPESWTAFEAYKKYNDYANETEKTDYTYSRLSKFRHKEIIPGFPIRPNLSRSPLTRSTNASKSYNFSYASDSYIRSTIIDKAGLRHRARQLYLGSEDESDISTTQPYEPYERLHVRTYRTITRSLVAIYTSIVYYIALSTSSTKNLFSKYVLRRDYTHYRFAPKSPGGSAFWIPYSPDGKYTSPIYLSGSSSYFYSFRSALYRFYERITTFVHVSSHNSIEFVKVKYSKTPRRSKILWFLIPLLLLAGLWLLSKEQEDGCVSKKWREFDISTFDLTGTVNDIAGFISTAAYSTYEGFSSAIVKTSSLIYQFFEELFNGENSPFLYIYEVLCSGFSIGYENLLYFISSVSELILKSVLYAYNLVINTLSSLWILAYEFLSSFFTFSRDGVKSAIIYSYDLLLDSLVLIRDILVSVFMSLWDLMTSGLSFVKTSVLYLISVAGDDGVYDENIHAGSDLSQQELFEQHKAIAKLTKELKDFKMLSGDLEALKKRIDDLEEEFRKEKEARSAGNEAYDKQLEENYKALQKFQVTVNHALRRCCSRSSQWSSLAIRKLFEAQSEELKLWITENFLQKSDPSLIDDKKIEALISEHTNRTGEDLKILQAEFKRFVEDHKTELESLRQNIIATEGNSFDSGDISVAFIRKLIADAIKLYDADKTGKVDFALESGGGQVQSIRCTETYIASSKSYILLGWTVYTSSSSPRDAINPGMAPGQCWAFVGSQGYLVLQLSHTIIVSGFTMEHISRLLVPNGHIESAPKNFSMWGLKNESDLDPYLFGEYTFLDNDETLQYFPVAHQTDEPFKFVELKITSNHGNPNYTCLYRIRVHGKVYPVQL